MTTTIRRKGQGGRGQPNRLFIAPMKATSALSLAGFVADLLSGISSFKGGFPAPRGGEFHKGWFVTAYKAGVGG